MINVFHNDSMHVYVDITDNLSCQQLVDSLDE